MRDKAQEWLCKEMRKARIALGHAEGKPGVSREELDNLRGKVEVVDWLLERLGCSEGCRWVSVKDSLPDASGLYIVCCNDEGSYRGEGIWYASGVIVCADTYVDKNGRVTWSWCEGATEYDLEGIVTHWMPLPEPPKEDNQ